MLKILCLLHGRQIVSTRKCHRCRLRRLEREREATGNTGPLPNYLYPAAINSSAGWWHDGDRDDLLDGNVNEMAERDQRGDCKVCCSMWWNEDGEKIVYAEQNIGK